MFFVIFEAALAVVVLDSARVAVRLSAAGADFSEAGAAALAVHRQRGQASSEAE
jgi:hypothetical protein